MLSLKTITIIRLACDYCLSIPGYPDHMSLSDFRCRFQALSPPVMKRYGSVFITPNERKVWWSKCIYLPIFHLLSFHLQLNFKQVFKKQIYDLFSVMWNLNSKIGLATDDLLFQAVEELLIELDMDKKSIVLGASKVGAYIYIKWSMVVSDVHIYGSLCPCFCLSICLC